MRSDKEIRDIRNTILKSEKDGHTYTARYGELIDITLKQSVSVFDWVLGEDESVFCDVCGEAIPSNIFVKNLVTGMRHCGDCSMNR